MVTPVVSGAWNAQLYALEALRYLSNTRPFLMTTNTRYETERRAFGLGDTITIKKRQTPTVRTDADLSYDALAPGTLQLTVDQYRHASSEIADWDLAFAGQECLDMHVFPAVDALADNITSHCLQKAYQGVGPYSAVSDPAAAADITAAQKVLMTNKAPIQDEANMHFVISPAMNAELLNLSAFTQWQGSGATGVQNQRTGQLTPRYGFNFHPTQLLSTHAPGTLGGSPAVNGAVAKGATTLALDGAATSGTVKAGDAFTIAGDSTVYVVTADATASSGAIAALTFAPELQVAAANDAVMNFATFQSAVASGDVMNMAYHSDAFAFCAVPLPVGPQHTQAADIGVATDPQSGLSLRVVMAWDAATRKSKMTVDALFGFKVLNPMLAVRAYQTI
jgi:hypothetical protein